MMDRYPNFQLIGIQLCQAVSDVFSRHLAVNYFSGGQRLIYYEIYHFCQTPKHDWRKKWSDVQHNPRAAVVIDDIVSFNPWKVRGVEVRGEVEVLPTGGETVVPGGLIERLPGGAILILKEEWVFDGDVGMFQIVA